MDKDEPHAGIGGNQHEEGTPDSVRALPLVSETGLEEPQIHCDTKPSNCCKWTERFWDFKASHWVTAILTGALVWVGIQQVAIYRRQAGIMNNQISEMQSEQRAWVSLTKDSGIEDLSVSDANELRATMKFGLQNTGKNPAVSVFVNVEMSIGTVIPYGSMPAWQTAVCAQPNGPLGTTMFPGSPEPTFSINTGLTATELAARKTLGTVLVPIIAACIVYKDAVTKEMHHTPIAYQIRMRVPRPGRGCCAIVSIDLPLTVEDLVLQTWVRGNLSPD